jgi:hypothetical protein
MNRSFELSDKFKKNLRQGQDYEKNSYENNYLKNFDPSLNSSYFPPQKILETISFPRLSFSSTEVNLQYMDCKSYLFLEFIKTLPSFQCLQIVNLSFSKVDNEIIFIFSEILPEILPLKSLILSNNSIGDKGLNALLEAFKAKKNKQKKQFNEVDFIKKDMNQCTSIFLDGNLIGNTGAMLLVQNIQFLDIEMLDLRNNPIFGSSVNALNNAYFNISINKNKRNYFILDEKQQFSRLAIIVASLTSQEFVSNLFNNAFVDSCFEKTKEGYLIVPSKRMSLQTIGACFQGSKEHISNLKFNSRILFTSDFIKGNKDGGLPSTYRDECYEAASFLFVVKQDGEESCFEFFIIKEFIEGRRSSKTMINKQKNKKNSKCVSFLSFLTSGFCCSKR